MVEISLKGLKKCCIKQPFRTKIDLFVAQAWGEILHVLLGLWITHLIYRLELFLGGNLMTQSM